MKRAFLLLGFGLLAASLSPLSSQAALVFDNISNYEKGVTGAAVTSTSSTPNTFMGDGYTLTPGTVDITGFDLFPANLAGTTYSSLRLTVYVWGTVNTGTVSATAPAFSNLLSSYTLTSTNSYPSGSFFPFESATPGSAPGVTLTTPLVLTGNTVGLTFAYQGSTDGVTYTSVNNLTSLISYGTAPAVGALTLGGATGGYYRNANSELNGNFTSTLRTLTGFTGQGVAVRVYGDVVPEPGAWAMIALTGVGLLAWRKRAALA